MDKSEAFFARTAPDGERAIGGIEASTNPELRRSLLRGISGMLLIYTVLSVLYTTGTPPFFNSDESSNVAYALELAKGELPTNDTPIPTEDFPELERRVEYDISNGMGHRTEMWTASHPPLFYLLMAGPVGAGVEFGVPLTGLWVAKALNVLVGAGAVVATVALARVLVPGSPRIALMAGGWLVLVPLVTTQPVGLYNDFLAVLTAMGLLASAVKLVRRGRTAGGVAAVAVWASAAGLTRVTGLLFVAVAVLLTIIAAGAAQRTTAQRFVTGARDGMVVLFAVGLTSGWFYLRNVRLQGGVPGAVGGGSESYQSVWGTLMDPGFWTHQLFDVFSGAARHLIMRSHRYGFPDTGLSEFPFTMLAVGLGIVVASLMVPPLVFGVRGVFVGADVRREGLKRGPGIVIWPLVLGCGPVVLGMSAVHASQGGNPLGRYLLQGLPVVAIVAALAWTGFSKRGPSGIAVAVLGLALLGNLLQWVTFAHVRYGAGDFNGIGEFSPLAAVFAVPGGWVLVPLAALGLIAGTVLYVRGFNACPYGE